MCRRDPDGYHVAPWFTVRPNDLIKRRIALIKFKNIYLQQLFISLFYLTFYTVLYA